MRRDAAIVFAAMAAVAALVAPAYGASVYWSPGTNTVADSHYYVVCDTVRTFCYDVQLEMLVPVLHQNKPYWVTSATMSVLAGFPPDTEFPPGYMPDRWKITGDPELDIWTLADAVPPGMPASTFVLLYDDILHPPFIDHSRVLVDSLADTVFGINDLMEGAGPVSLGERWGDLMVVENLDGLYVVEYIGEGSASFLVDPARPMPLAGIYRADRYDVLVSGDHWFYSERKYLDMLLGSYAGQTVSVSGPDSVMRSGTLAGMTWTSDTYFVETATTSPGRLTIQGAATGEGMLRVVMPATSAEYSFRWDGGTTPAKYGVNAGVLTAEIRHGAGTGAIEVHAIPDEVCTGDCLRDLVVRGWDGPAAIVYGGGFHGSVRLTMVGADPNGIAADVCPPGSRVTVDFDVMPARIAVSSIPYATTYESSLDVEISREGSNIYGILRGDPGAVTLRMPAMTGTIQYYLGGELVEPVLESSYRDVVTATLEHPGGNATYSVISDGPSAWRVGLSLPAPVDRTGVVWCGMSEPVNVSVIRDNGPARQDCGTTKFDGGWNAWC